MAEETGAASEAAIDTAQYSERDYTYMYLVTTKKVNYTDGSYYSKDVYIYNNSGFVSEKKNGSKSSKKTSFSYDGANLINVEGSTYDFSYSYDSNGRMIKYDMASYSTVVGDDGPYEFKHKLKRKKKDRSIFNPRCSVVALLSKGDKYFFNKDGTIKKMYYEKGSNGKAWSEKIYYSYDKHKNLVKEKHKSFTYPDSPDANETRAYTLKYKNNHLMKKVEKRFQLTFNYSYKYKKIKVLKEYKQAIKEQQWRILNFEDRESFGICQSWSY